MTIQRYPLTKDTHLGIQKDYKIVGIYTAPEWSSGAHSFHADTIFVPKASVPGIAPRTESLQFLHSVIIENGSIDAFEEHMAANDMAGAYLYFDQGYTEAAASVRTLIDNAERIMIVGISMFVLSSLLFLLLFIRRTAPVVRTMRLLGVSAKKTWSECFISLISQVVIAVLVGNALAGRTGTTAGKRLARFLCLRRLYRRFVIGGSLAVAAGAGELVVDAAGVHLAHHGGGLVEAIGVGKVKGLAHKLVVIGFPCRKSAHYVPPKIFWVTHVFSGERGGGPSPCG